MESVVLEESKKQAKMVKKIISFEQYDIPRVEKENPLEFDIEKSNISTELVNKHSMRNSSTGGTNEMKNLNSLKGSTNYLI